MTNITWGGHFGLLLTSEIKKKNPDKQSAIFN